MHACELRMRERQRQRGREGESLCTCPSKVNLDREGMCWASGRRRQGELLVAGDCTIAPHICTHARGDVWVGIFSNKTFRSSSSFSISS